MKEEESKEEGKPKKEKKKKEDKPKAEKKEQPAEDKEVGPKMFSMIDLRVSELVECWKVNVRQHSTLSHKISTVRRYWSVER